LGSVAMISLLVGAIGIANVMLVSVTERTREIGIRMAVGARARDVLFQFLTEAVVLAVVGGFLGLGLGTGVAKYMAFKAQWPTLLSGPVMAATMLLAGLAGVVAGFYPALRASRLDPIDALRFEEQAPRAGVAGDCGRAHSSGGFSRPLPPPRRLPRPSGRARLPLGRPV